MKLAAQHFHADSTLRGSAPPLKFAFAQRQLAATVLLAGGVRPDSFREAIQRSGLDLPLAPGRSLLLHWCEQIGELAECGPIGNLRLQIALDHGAPAPALVPTASRLSLHLERDRSDFRGSGGVLHDIAANYDDDDVLLVATAGRVWLGGLSSTIGSLARTEADVAMSVAPDGTPSGLMLVRCGVLRNISPVGFVDFKEQALPQIARAHDVAVVACNAPTYPVRTLPQYIHALMQLHRQALGLPALHDAFAEDWRRTFGLIEDGGDVASDACVHDSVVLRGGKVETGAVVVRSLVCPGGVVSRGEVVVDQVVSARAHSSRRRS